MNTRNSSFWLPWGDGWRHLSQSDFCFGARSLQYVLTLCRRIRQGIPPGPTVCLPKAVEKGLGGRKHKNIFVPLPPNTSDWARTWTIQNVPQFRFVPWLSNYWERGTGISFESRLTLQFSQRKRDFSSTLSPLFLTWDAAKMSVLLSPRKSPGYPVRNHRPAFHRC